MKFQLYRVYLNGGGYEVGTGYYYGQGMPIYRYLSDDAKGHGEFRAMNRKEAKKKLIQLHPDAKFYN